MVTKLQKWGNSQGIRISKSILDMVNWKSDDYVWISVKDDKLIIEKASTRKRKSIEELFADFQDEYEPVTVEWEEPVGEEIW